MTLMQYQLIITAAYLIGSFSSGIHISSSQGRDIRSEGSGSSGATNVARVLGTRFGLLTFACDFLKTALAVGFGWLISGRAGTLAAGIFVVIGHNWPVYYHFRGGKGVVCSTAVLLILFPLEALAAGAAAILVIWLSRYVSLGSLVLLLASAALISIFRGFLPSGLWSVILLGLALFQHRSNVARLIQGRENKLSFKR